MQRQLILPLVLVAAIMLPVVSAQNFPLGADDPVVVGAIEYIAAHQCTDGGFSQHGASDLSATRHAVEAIAAAGRDPLAYKVNGFGPDDYVLSVSDAVFLGEYGTNPLAEKINMLLALSACGLNARDFGIHDHIQSLLSEQNESAGSFGLGASDTAYCILALRAAGVPVTDPALQRAKDYLEGSQLADGGFEYSPGWGADSNTLSVAIIALKQMDPTGSNFWLAASALPHFQNANDRGFFYQSMWGTDSDVSSTALGIQAISAIDCDPTESIWALGGENPLKYILGIHRSETGEFFDQWGSLRPTSLALPAVMGRVTPGINIVGELWALPASLVILPFVLRGFRCVCE